MRRIALVFLDLHPPWWRREDVWLATALLLLVPVWATRARASYGNTVAFSYVELKAGRWAILASYHGDAPHFDFSAECACREGPGWRRWTLSPTVVGVNSAKASAQQVEAARYAGFQMMADAWTNEGAPGSDWMTVSLEGLRDGRRGAWTGWFYPARLGLLALGILGLSLGLLAGACRWSMRLAYKQRLKTTFSVSCPRCGYPKVREDSEVCPECGLRFAAYVDEARKELS